MVKIVGVRFRNAGKVYYFDPKDYKIKPGDHVIVETARGIEYATVSGKVQEVADHKVVQPLKPVIRVANAEDDARAKRNREKEREAMAICKEKIRKHNLDMKLIDAEYTFDNNKVLFYFTADGRIDFRELVKDLAAVFRTRIELRQIGVRDETKILGGVGICGRPLCCSTFLSEFAPVSIKMAKEQNLSLNPTKISGVCGRLMCCLKNEEETYEYLHSKLPGIGDTVTTITGLQGEVASVNVLRQKVKVLVDVDDEKELQEYDVKDLKFKPRRKKEKNSNSNNGNSNRSNSEKGSGKDREEKENARQSREDRENARQSREERENSRQSREGRENPRQNREERENSFQGREDRENARQNREERENSRQNREFRERRKRASKNSIQDQEERELQELEALEQKESRSRLEDDQI